MADDADSLVRRHLQGASYDSPGNWSVWLHRAAASRSGFLQAYPAWPWLRAVAWAHRHGAERLEFESSRTRLRLVFTARDCQDWSRAVAWMEHGAAGADPRLIDLLFGWIASPARRFEIRLGPGRHLVWEREARPSWKVDDSGHPANLVDLRVDYPEPGWFRTPVIAKLGEELRQRCGFAAIPTLWDGELIGPAHFSTLPGLVLPEDPAILERRYQAFLDLERGPHSLWSPVSDAAEERLIWPIQAPAWGQVCLIRDGVACDVCPCELGFPGAVLVTRSRELKTDASGLALVVDEAFERLRGLWSESSRGYARELRRLLADSEWVRRPGLDETAWIELRQRLARVPS